MQSARLTVVCAYLCVTVELTVCLGVLIMPQAAQAIVVYQALSVLHLARNSLEIAFGDADIFSALGHSQEG